ISSSTNKSSRCFPTSTASYLIRISFCCSAFKPRFLSSSTSAFSYTDSRKPGPRLRCTSIAAPIILAVRSSNSNGILDSFAPGFLIKSPCVVDQLYLHARHHGGFLFQAAEELLAEINEPGFAAALFGRLGWARHLEDFDQVAGLGGHQKDAIPQIDGLLDGMGDEKNGVVLLPPEVEEQLLHAEANAGIKRAERFIHEQNPRTQNDGGRQ